METRTLPKTRGRHPPPKRMATALVRDEQNVVGSRSSAGGLAIQTYSSTCTIRCGYSQIRIVSAVSALGPDTVRYNTYRIYCIWVQIQWIQSVSAPGPDTVDTRIVHVGLPGWNVEIPARPSRSGRPLPAGAFSANAKHSASVVFKAGGASAAAHLCCTFCV